MWNINLKRIPIFGAIVFAFSFLLFFSQISPVSAAFNADDVIKLTNEARLSQGLAVLAKSDMLTLAAQKKAEDMLKNDYFAHNSPSGLDPWHWFQQVGYPYRHAGENLAVNYLDAEKQQAAWMKSLTHRKNILNADFREIGVAVVKGKVNGEETLLTVQLFGSRAPIPVESQPRKTDPAPQTKGVEIKQEVPLVQPEALGVPEKSQTPVILEPFESGRQSAMAVFSFSTLSIAAILIFGAASEMISQRKRKLEERESKALMIPGEYENFLKKFHKMLKNPNFSGINSS